MYYGDSNLKPLVCKLRSFISAKLLSGEYHTKSQATKKIKFDMQIESIVTEMASDGLARLVNVRIWKPSYSDPT